MRPSRCLVVFLLAFTAIGPLGHEVHPDQVRASIEEGSTPAKPPAPDGPARSSRRRVALPEEDPHFISLLGRLADRAAGYRRAAKGFTCRELVTTADYDLDSSDFRKSDKRVHDYLFEENPPGVLREAREAVKEDKNGVTRNATDFEAPVPPAYTWASLFSRENRGRFHFRPAGQILKAYRLLTLIHFVGISPNPGGNDIAGWSGQVALEGRSLNLWSVEAAPSGQDVRLEAEILRYRKAFAIMGVPLASRPHGWQLHVTFGMEKEGLSYPTEQVLQMTSLTRDGKMNLEEKTTFRYEQYRFFTEVIKESEATPSQNP